MFYKPYASKCHNIPQLIVVEDNVNDDLGEKAKAAEYLQTMYAKHNVLQEGAFHVVFLWKLDTHIMTDVWIFLLTQWSAVPDIDIRNFIDGELTHDHGTTAGDGLLLVADLERERRKHASLDKWLAEFSK
jgi:hypothetical protein